LAIFDRFGKLVLGSEEVLKKVLEYVVFECHIAQQGSKWLLHAKSNPQWFEPKSPSTITFRVHDDDDQPRKAIGAGRQKINLIK
jgi:large subunit ribosomal protein L45